MPAAPSTPASTPPPAPAAPASLFASSGPRQYALLTQVWLVSGHFFALVHAFTQVLFA
jgi:hypothetical protein